MRMPRLPKHGLENMRISSHEPHMGEHIGHLESVQEGLPKRRGGPTHTMIPHAPRRPSVKIGPSEY